LAKGEAKPTVPVNKLMRPYGQPIRLRQSAKARASQVETTLREEEAFRLRRQGLTFRQIGAEMGISDKGAINLFYCALNQRTVPIEEVEEYRRSEVERLEGLRMRVWDRARLGDDDAIQSYLRIHDRIARMLGLNAPEKVEINISVKAQMMAAVVRRLDVALADAGVPVEQQQQIASAILEGASELPGGKPES
jgi:predicted DNA-binding protein (UPF0251 family)